MRHLQSPGLLLALLLTTHLYFANEFRAFPNPNVHSRLYLTLAIVDHGTLSIDPIVARFGPVQDVAVHGGRTFSDKPPGHSVALAPFAWLLRRTLIGADDLRGMAIALRIIGVSFPAVFFWCATRRFWSWRTGGERLGDALVLAGALGTNFFIYATQMFSHVPAAILLFVAARLAGRGARGSAAACGAALSAAFAFDHVVAPAVAVLAVVAVVAARHSRPIAAVLVLLGAAPIACGWMAYNRACFGSPIVFSYLQHADPHYRPLIEHGVLGLRSPDIRGLVGMFLLPSHGLLYMSPILVLALPGWRRMWQRGERIAAAAGAAVVGSVALFVSMLVDWRGGWSVSVRYLVPVLPFMLEGVAAAIGDRRARWSRAIFGVGAALGLFHVALAATTFPDFPATLIEPFFQLCVPLLASGCVNGVVWNSAAGAGWLAPFAFLSCVALVGCLRGVLDARLTPARLAAIVILLILVRLPLARGLDYQRRLTLADVMGRMGYTCQSEAARAALHADTLRTQPDNVYELTELAWIRATSPCEGLRDADEGVQLAERALRAGGSSTPRIQDVLAACLAAAGRFDEASAAAEEAIRNAGVGGSGSAPSERVDRWYLYRTRRPFVRPDPGR